MGTMDILKMMLTSIFRYLLAGVVGSLIGKGIITGFQGEMLIYIVAGTVLVIVTSLWSKFNVKEKIEVALGLPAGTSAEEFKEAVEEVKRLGTTKNLMVLGLIVPLLFSQTACGANSFKKALEASKDLGANTNDATERVRNLWQQGAISLTQKDHIARLLIQIGKAGKQGHEVLVALSTQYEKPSNVPADKWFDVDKVFNDQVVVPFLEMLTVVAGLNSETSAYLRVAISQVRNTILILSKLLGKQQSLIERINRIEGGDVYA